MIFEYNQSKNKMGLNAESFLGGLIGSIKNKGNVQNQNASDLFNPDQINQIKNITNEMDSFGLSATDAANKLNVTDQSVLKFVNNNGKITNTGMAIQGIGTKAKIASVGVKALNFALSAIMNIGIALLISVITKGIDDLLKKNEKYIESLDKTIDKSDELIKKYNDEEDALINLQSKLEESKGNHSELASVYEELNKYIKVNTDLIDGESSAYDAVNVKIQMRIQELKDLESQEKKTKDAALLDKYNNTQMKSSSFEPYSFNDFRNMSSRFGLDFAEYTGSSNIMHDEVKKTYNQLQEQFGNELSEYFIEDILAGSISVQGVVNEILKNFEGNMDMGWLWSRVLGILQIDNIKESDMDEFFNKQFETIKEYLGTFMDDNSDVFSVNTSETFVKRLIGMGLTPSEIQQELSNLYSNVDLKSAFNEFAESINSGEDITPFYNNLQNQFELLKKQMPYLTYEFDKFFLSIVKGSGVTEDLVTSLKKISYNSLYDEFKDKVELVASAQKELSDNGEMSLDTTYKLLESYPELEEQLTATATGYTITDDTLQTLIDDMTLDYKLIYDNAIKAANEVIAGENGQAEAYSNNTNAIKEQLNAKIALIEATELANAKSAYEDLGIGMGGLSQYKPYLDVLEKIQDIKIAINNIDIAEENYNEAQKLIDQLQQSIEDGNSSGDKWLDEFNVKFNKLKHQLAMEEITERTYFSELTDLNDYYFSGKEKYLDEYNQYLEEIYSGQNQLQENAMDNVKELRSTIIEFIKKQKNDMIDSLNEELDGLNKILDARKEALDLAREENDYQKDLSEKNKNVSDLNNELEALMYDDSASAMKKKLELREELNDKQKELDEFLADHAYDTQIKEIEKEKEANEKLYDDKIKEIQDFLDNEGKIMELANEQMANLNNELYTSLINWNMEYGSGIKKDIVDKWNAATLALGQYQNLLSKIDLPSDNKGGFSYENPYVGTSTNSSTNNISNTSTSNKTSEDKSDTTIPNNLSAIPQAAINALTKTIESMKKIQIGGKTLLRFNSGGETDTGEGIAYLHKKERVLTSVQTAAFDKFIYEYVPKLFNVNTNLSAIKDGATSIYIQEGDINIDGSVDDTVINKLKSLKKEFVQEVFDQAEKNKYKVGIKR